jgi:hypothetical protein
LKGCDGIGFDKDLRVEGVLKLKGEKRGVDGKMNREGSGGGAKWFLLCLF